MSPRQKLTDLPSVTSLTGEENIPLTQGAYINRCTLDQLWALYLREQAAGDTDLLFDNEDAQALYVKEDHPVNFNDNRLLQVGDAIDSGDAVNKNTMTKALQTEILANADPMTVGWYDFRDNTETDTVNNVAGYFPSFTVKGTTNIGQYIRSQITAPAVYCKFKDSDYLQYSNADSDMLLPFPFSVAFWFRSNTPTANEEDRLFLLETTNQRYVSNIHFSANTTVYNDGRVYVTGTGICNTAVTSSPWPGYGQMIASAVDTGTFNHIALVFGRPPKEGQTRPEMELYLNGVPNSDSPMVGVPEILQAKGLYMEIGRAESATGNNWLGDIRMFDKALSDEEVWGLYSRGRIPSHVYDEKQALGSNSSGILIQDTTSDLLMYHSHETKISVSNTAITLYGNVVCQSPETYRSPATKAYVDSVIASLAAENSLIWPPTP